MPPRTTPRSPSGTPPARRRGTLAQRQAALLRLSAEVAAANDEADICQRVVAGLHDDALGYDFLGMFLLHAAGDRVLKASIGWTDVPVNWRVGRHAGRHTGVHGT